MTVAIREAEGAAEKPERIRLLLSLRLSQPGFSESFGFTSADASNPDGTEATRSPRIRITNENTRAVTRTHDPNLL
jgi:hypothetical protein